MYMFGAEWLAACQAAFYEIMKFALPFCIQFTVKCDTNEVKVVL